MVFFGIDLYFVVHYFTACGCNSRFSPPERLRVDEDGGAGLWRASWVAVDTPVLFTFPFCFPFCFLVAPSSIGTYSMQHVVHSSSTHRIRPHVLYIYIYFLSMLHMFYLVYFLIYEVKSRSGHDRSQSFGSISHMSGPKLTLWGNFIMVLHGFVSRSPKIIS